MKKLIAALASATARPNACRVTPEVNNASVLAATQPAPDGDLRRVPVPRWAELLTRALDDAIGIPGTRVRIGLDGIIGLFLPGAGDAVTAIGAGALLLLAIQRRVPTSVLLRMLLNIAVDTCVGALPVIGDLFDFGYKSNRKNLELLKGERAGASARGRLGDALLLGAGFVLLASCILLPLLVWLLIVHAFQR